MKKLFIGKLSFSTTDSSLRDLFSSYEPLNSVKVITDKFTGDSRGFGFVEIEDSQSADEAIEALNGAMLDGRAIVVNEARPQADRPKTFGGGRQGYQNSNNERRSNYRSSSNNRF